MATPTRRRGRGKKAVGTGLDRDPFADIDPTILRSRPTGGDEIQEQCRQAISVMRGKLPGLNGYAKAVTGDPRMQVVIHAGPPCTDGNTIFMRPPIELGMKRYHEPALCGRRDKFDVLMCTACQDEEDVNITLRHEIGHIVEHSFQTMDDDDKAGLFHKALGEVKARAISFDEAVKHLPGWDEATDEQREEFRAAHADEFAEIAKLAADKRLERLRKLIDNREKTMGRPLSFVEANNLISPWLPQIFNGLEDARVNVAMYSARPGLYKQFKGHVNKLFQEGFRRDDGTIVTYGELPPNVQIIIGLMSKAMGYDYAEFLDKEVVDVVDSPEITRLIKHAQQARSARSIYKLGFPILEALKAKGFCRDHNDDPQDFPEPPPMRSEKSDDDEDEKQANADAQPGERDDSDSSEPEQESDPQHDADDTDEDSEQAASAGENDDDAEAGDDEGDGDVGHDDDDAENGPADDDADEESTGAADDDDDADDGNDDTGGDNDADDGDDAGEGAGDADDDADDDDDADSEGGGGMPGADGTGDFDDDADDADADSSPDATGDEAWDEDDEDDNHRECAECGGIDGDHEDDCPDNDEGDDGDGSYEGDSDESFAGDDDESDASESSSDGGGMPSEAESEPWNPFEDGTPDEAEKAMEKIGGHKAGWNPMSEHEDGHAPTQPSDIEMDRAILQADFFDAPSRHVFGVKVHTTDGPGLERYEAYATILADPEAAEGQKSYYAAEMEREFPTLQSPESVLGPALRQMRLTFDANKATGHKTNLRSGNVNIKVLGRRVPVNDDRLFSKRRRPAKRDYFVVLGLDISGSTYASTEESDGEDRLRVVRMKMAVQAQADLLHRAGIPFAVYAHTGTRNPDLSSTVDVNIHVVKGPNDKWDVAAHERLRTISSAQANLDGHTMEFYRKVCEKQHATDKVIMYYTDGAMPAENYTEELEVLQRELKMAAKRGVTIVGVGVDTDAPIEHGLDTIRLDDVRDIAAVVRGLKERLA